MIKQYTDVLHMIGYIQYVIAALIHYYLIKQPKKSNATKNTNHVLADISPGMTKNQ